MPFINSKTNVKIADNIKDEIKARLGNAVSIIGKSEGWLMVGFEDEYSLYFKGDGQTPCVYVEVSLYGSSTRDKYSRLTAEICEIYNNLLGIDKSRVYVKYEETDNWGWNGSNL